MESKSKKSEIEVEDVEFKLEDWEPDGLIVEFEPDEESYDENLVDTGRKPRLEWLSEIDRKYRTEMDEDEIEANEGYQLIVDLPQQIVSTPSKEKFSFEVDIFAKNCLLKGLDDIGWTLQFEENISDFEKKVEIQKPWLFFDE